MCKGIRTDDGLVRLNRKSGDTGYQARGSDNLRGINLSLHRKDILTGAHRHDNFFQRSIAGALTQTINGTFDLPCALHDGSEGVGNRQTEVIVAMHRKNCLVCVRHCGNQATNSIGVFRRKTVTHRIGEVDRASASIDHLFDDTTHEIKFRTTGIFQ